VLVTAIAISLAGARSLAAFKTAALLDAPHQSSGYALLDTWRDLPDPTRVTAGIDGRVHVLVSGGTSARHMSTDGTLLGQTPTFNLREIAVDPSGNLYGIGGLSIYRVDGEGNLMWQDRIQGTPHGILGERPPYLAMLEWDPSADAVLLLFDRDETFTRHYNLVGRDSAGLTLAYPNHAYWDIGVTASRVYMLNRATSSVEVYESGGLVDVIPLPAATERIAVGDDGTVFALSDRRWVYRIDAVSHDALEAWSVRDAVPGATKSTALDLAVDDSGRVYIADPNRDQVRVYAPVPGEPIGRLPAPDPGPGCQMIPDKTAAPTYLRLGELTKVTLTLNGECQDVAERADIVIVMDRSDSMNYEGGTKIAAAKASVLSFLSIMEWERDQVALVTFASDSTIDVPLTHDRARLEAAVNAVSAGSGTHIAGAIDRTVEALQGPTRRPDAKPIVVFMTDGVAFDTSRLRAVAASDRLRYADIPFDESVLRPRITTYTIGFGQDVDPDLLKVIATSPAHYYYAPEPDRLEDVYRTIARNIKASVLWSTVEIVDYVPDNMEYQLNSALPPAFWDLNARTLTWTFYNVPFEGTQLSYWLEPLEVGEWPTNVRADYDGLDGLDQPQDGPFPIPRVVVVAPTDTPEPSLTPVPTTTPGPTPTPSPSPRVSPTPSSTLTATTSPTATRPTPVTGTPVTPSPSPVPPTPTIVTPQPTPDLYTIYVIIVFNSACFKRHTDVTLVIDASTTMLEQDERGRRKIESAKDAARSFVNQLQLEPDLHGRHDQAAIVWYNDTAGVAQPLTNDREALLAAIDSLEPKEGSRIDLGLQFGHRELLPEFRSNRILANRPAMVLMSDGLPNRVPTPVPIGPQEETIVNAADDAKRDGIVVYAVGYGRNVHEPLLRRVASQPEQYFFAPSGAELARIYRSIAGDLVCR
jgi:Mg-chelatase subunit ChlD